MIEVADFYSVAELTIESEGDRSPEMLIYTKFAPDWATFPDGVPEYDILPPELSGET